MLKIGLVGYGKMGKKIHALSKKSKDYKVISIIDPFDKKANFSKITPESIKNCDVCIEFSNPKVVLENIKKLINLDMPTVVGTTGWYKNIKEITDLVSKQNGSLIYATNFSIGVNMLFQITNYASNLINQVKEYDVAGFESHHNMKKDIPSGTAKTLANIIKDNYDTKENIIYQPGNRKVKENELHFTSMRLGSINGDHEITFDSLQDQISIKHSAKNRDGFAKGALTAAKYINKNLGFINFNDNFNEILQEVNNGI
ncbi:MAG: 4-hydroxy-tetrahydrodipicolinate reductase [Bacillota bacterium]